MNIKIDDVHNFFLTLQNNIVSKLENIENANFIKDKWNNINGNGISCFLENGKVFERAAVLFSNVSGNHLPVSATNKRPELQNNPWQAMGISLVIHPRNPYIPTTHMNSRFFICHSKLENVFWFGGGMDLTPYYIYEDDAKHFHTTCYNSLLPYGKEYYFKFKKLCDEYFFLKHRNETRGIGGIFFDDLNNPDFETTFSILKSTGNAFLDAYIPIVEKRKNYLYGNKERSFQLYRRGRYVEFNLLFDRGTLFGIQSNGRTESILLSMPPMATWKYEFFPEKDSQEEKLYQFLKPIEWIKNI